jgi:DDE superfamily endonuclease
LTVRADGIDIPPFVIYGQVGNATIASGRRPKKGEKPVRGMNKELMKLYADHISQRVDEPSLLILDRLSSHTSGEVRDYIEDYVTPDGQQLFTVLLLPPKTAFLLSPLDNGANSAFKQHFYKYDRSTFPLKKSAVKLAWDAVSNETLSNICNNCGLASSETLQAIRKRFEKEVHGMIPEKLQPSQELFEQWKAGAILVSHGRGLKPAPKPA